MLTLADIQRGIRDAVVNGNGEAVAAVLVGGTRPEHRLAIHRRHYEASLTRALVERFPATVWLVGSELVTHAATSFIHEHPPSRPCIAEYGDGFPRYLGAHPAAVSLPYLAQFAELEWHLGRLALATEESENVQYIHLAWTLDELIGFYQGKIAKWWTPDDVVFVDAIPLGATGKMLKNKLREQFRDHRLPG